MSVKKKSLSFAGDKVFVRNILGDRCFASCAKQSRAAVFLVSVALLSGCATQSSVQLQPPGLAAPKKSMGQAGQQRGARSYKSGPYKNGANPSPRGYYNQASYSDALTERRCLERAMFFESNRNGREGLIAVGTVVMNRVHSSEYPNTICGVVGQKNQFAPGVLTRSINMALIPDVVEAADTVLRGERAEKLKNAMYFHTAGLHFPYNNMHYVLVAGGNSFYERRRRDGSLSNAVHDSDYDVAYAYAQERGDIAPAFVAIDSAIAADSGKASQNMQNDTATDLPENKTDSIQTASVRRVAVPHIRGSEIIGKRNTSEPASVVEALNASLTGIYDRRADADREKRIPSASYDAVAVPVPYLKANFAAAAPVPRAGSDTAASVNNRNSVSAAAANRVAGMQSAAVRETSLLPEVSANAASVPTRFSKAAEK